MSARLAISLIAALLVGAARGAAFDAFADGETFTYRASWGLLVHAGDIVIAAHAEKTPAGIDVVRITTDTSTRGIVRGFYSYNNRAEGLIDRQTGRLILMREKGTDGRHSTDTETVFDYANSIADFTDHHRPDRSKKVSIPAGDPVDLMSALVATRNWDIKPGEKRDVLVNFSDEFLPISIHAERYETVRTPLGEFEALLLVPRMDQDPRGIFKRGGQIRVWISQNSHKLPVKMQVKLGVVLATLSLSSYQPGPAAVPAAAAGSMPQASAR